MLEHQQVELSSLMRCPEVGLVGLRKLQHLLQQEPFPRGTELGMGKLLGFAAQAEQRMQQSG